MSDDQTTFTFTVVPKSDLIWEQVTVGDVV